MRVEIIPQVELGTVQRKRVGDFLNAAISDTAYERFRFAVAYMRLSGLDRLAASIEGLTNRGGVVSGAVGIDDGITSYEALQSLQEVSQGSTVFHTVSGFIFHPKLYLLNGQREAVAVVGSPNLTRDGLFRNIELANAVFLDLQQPADRVIYGCYDSFINEFLNTSHPNVKPINIAILQTLLGEGLIKSEAETREPGVPIDRVRGANNLRSIAGNLFPPIQIPIPPAGRAIRQPNRGRQRTTARTTAQTVASTANAFIMQLSAFDSSHRSGVQGTAEILIPHAAKDFFPSIGFTGRKYPDTLFDVLLYTPYGSERHQYRFWYYEERATGKRIDEYRLRMDKETIDLSSAGGGDLIVIAKLPPGSNPSYEVTIVSRQDPMFQSFLALCTNRVQDKLWGMA